MPTSTDSFPLLWSSEQTRPIPNGRFTIFSEASSLTHHFMIYTVQNGSLKDQRIIKYKPIGSQTYKGFAFLMSDGSVKLWRSQSPLGDTDLFKMAEKFVRYLWDVQLFTSDYISGIAWTANSMNFANSFTITWKNQCVRCNTLIDTGANDTCIMHRDCRLDLRADIEREERLIRYESQRARRGFSNLSMPALSDDEVQDVRTIRGTPIRGNSNHQLPSTESLQPISPLRAQRPDVRRFPILSENGTGLIR